MECPHMPKCVGCSDWLNAPKRTMCLRNAYAQCVGSSPKVRHRMIYSSRTYSDRDYYM